MDAKTFETTLSAVLSDYKQKVSHHNCLPVYGGMRAVPPEFLEAATRVAIQHRIATTGKDYKTARKDVDAEKPAHSNFGAFVGHLRKQGIKGDGLSQLSRAILANDFRAKSAPDEEFDNACYDAILVDESAQFDQHRGSFRAEYHRSLEKPPIGKQRSRVERLSSHGYIQMKGLSDCMRALEACAAYDGLDGRIKVPMLSAWRMIPDESGSCTTETALSRCLNVESIPSNPEDVKRPVDGLSTHGLFRLVGSFTEFEEASRLVVVEGFATALSVYEAGDCPVIAVGGCSNFLKVLAALDHAEKFKKILLVGDGGADSQKRLSKVQAAIEVGSWRKAGRHFAWTTIPGTHNRDANDLHQEEGLGALMAFLDDAWANFEDFNKPKGKDFLIPSSVYAETCSPPKWLVKNWLQEGSFWCVIADPNSFKTFFVTELATSLALGTTFHGFKTRQVNVLLVLGEGGASFTARQRGLHLERGYDGLPNNLHLSRGPVNLLDESDCRLVSEYCAANDIELLVFDTLSRNLLGNENDTEAMSRVVFNITKFFIEHGRSVGLVHHTGHGDKTRGRGSSVLPGAVDTQFILNRTDEESVKIICTKQKDSEPLADQFFKRSIVQTGMTDEDGLPITTVVLNPAAAPDKRLTLSKQESEVWSALKQLDSPFRFERAMDQVKLRTGILRNIKRVLNSTLCKLCESGELTQFGEEYIIANP